MSENDVKPFEEMISEAEAWELKGWDFSSIADRWVESPPPWNYRTRVLARLPAFLSALKGGVSCVRFYDKDFRVVSAPQG